MKANIHPKWNPEAQVSCSCGNMFTVGSTKDYIRVEVCNKCHPFYTGQQKFVDTLGRVERFQQKQKTGQAQAQILADKKKKKAQKQAEARSPKSLCEMLLGNQ